MDKKLKSNYLYNLIYQIIAIIIPIILIPYLSRTLGSEGIGTYGYTISIVTYFLLFGSLGINLYGQKVIASSKNNNKKMSRIFWELFYIKMVCLLIMSVVFIVLFCYGNSMSLLYKILLIEFLSNIFDITWLYQGLEKFKKIMIRNFIIKIISIILILLFVKSPADTWIYLLIYCLSNFLGNISLWLDLNKNVVFIRVHFKSLKSHFKVILSFFIPQVAIQVYAILDKTMIGLVLEDMNEVGYYELSQKVIRILMTLITSLGVVLLPRIASCFSEKKFDDIKKYVTESFRIVFFIIFPMIFGLIVISSKFVPLFFGEGYNKAIILLIMFSLSILPISISNITGNAILLPQNFQNKYTYSVVAGAVINFTLNIFLIKKIGTLGAVISTVISESLITIIQLYYSKNIITFYDLLNLSFKYCISSLFMFGTCLALSILKINSIYILVLQITLGALIYFIFLYILKDDLFYKFTRKFFTKKQKC